MPMLNVEEAIELLKKARAAAAAVKEEIERQNLSEIDPDAVARREPVLQSAKIVIQDADEKIDNLEASQAAVEIDAPDVEKLTQLAEELDAKIAANALLNLGIDSLTQVLNSASEVKKALG